MQSLKIQTRLKKLKNKLSYAMPDQFFTMVWAADAIRVGRAEDAKKYFRFPKEIATPNKDQPFTIIPWKAETLVNEFLCTPHGGRKGKTLICTEWNTYEKLQIMAMQLEDAESVSDLHNDDILPAIPRVLWQQFPWLQGFPNAMHLYRSWYLHNFPAANDHFKDEHGFDIATFCKIAFATYAYFRSSPAMPANTEISEVGITVRCCYRRDIYFMLLAYLLELRKVYFH